MEVRVAYDVIKQFDGKILAGENGFSREVHSIEVMEVPNVKDWVTEGVLVVSTFYSVKDDQERQLQIIKSLIDVKAAGMIIKLGRFIESLSNEMIQLANRYNFPIISLPKDVQYIELLTPLYALLQNKEQMPHKSTAYNDFENMSFSTVQETIDYLSETINHPIYIEDLTGKLLYSSRLFFSDGWRDTRLLFSIPSEKDFLSKIVGWTERLQTESYIDVQTVRQRSRVIVPLKMNENIFAIIHLTYINSNNFAPFDYEEIKVIKNKIHEVMMRELIEQQQRRIMQTEQLNTLIANDNRQTPHVLLYFKHGLNQIFSSPRSSIMDYHTIYRMKVDELMKEMAGVKEAIIFEKQSQIYVLLSFPMDNPIEKLSLQDAISDPLSNSHISDSYVAVSSIFTDLSQLDEKMNAVTKIMQIGMDMDPDKKVFSYGKLGIYEFLIKLSNEQAVQDYVNEVIGPIAQHSDKNLLNTLIAYLQQNGNASKAAEKLFIHRRTMTNRLLRIKHLLNMNLDDPENIFILQFCLKIRGLG